MSDKINKKIAKKHNKSKYKLVLTIKQIIFGLVFISFLLISYLFYKNIEHKIKQSTDISSYREKNVSNFFDKKTVEKTRDVIRKTDSIKLTPGRQNPFDDYNQ